MPKGPEQDHVYLAREDGLRIPKARDPFNPNGPIVVEVPCRECGRPADEHPKPKVEKAPAKKSATKAAKK